MDGQCPDSFYCDGGISHGYGAISSKLLWVQDYAGLISSVLSVIGASIILLAYFAFKDLRKGTAQTIITLLALADLGAALGFLLGVGNFLTYYHLKGTNSDLINACSTFGSICEVQSFIALWCFISSSIWSTILALHFVLATVFDHSSWTARMLPLYNIVAWILPLILLLPLLVGGNLGYTPTYRAFCYISASANNKETEVVEVFEESVIWALILVFTVITAISYAILLAHILRKPRHAQHGRRIGKRLLAIPVAYLFLRLGDIIVVPLGMSTPSSPLACGSDGIQMVTILVSSLQVISDPGQGWINCILFIFLSPELRNRMFIAPFKRGVGYTQKAFNTNRSATSATAPLAAVTERTPSTGAMAQKENITYYPHPNEFPESTD